MNRQQKLQTMMERFVHPNSDFAQQIYADGSRKLKEGTYFFRVTQGECTHNPPHKRKKHCEDVVSVPFNEDYLAEHLKGQRTYAPYQISKDGNVKWVCFDVDAYAESTTEEIQNVTKAVARSIQKTFGPNHCLVEESGSKGYHIWIFFTQPVDVGKAFALGHKLVQTIEKPDTINIEIYPKQQSNKVFGNTVKLPLGIHQKTNKRCVFVNARFEAHEDQWGKLKNVQAIEASWVSDNVEVEKQEPRPIQVATTATEYGPYTPLCLVDILRDGCQEGIRDEAAFREACYFRDKGIPQDLAYGLMQEWNKKNSPPLDQDDLVLKVEQAYISGYSWRPCHLPAFDHVCHSACQYFDKKKDMRWFSDTSAIGKISRD